MIDLTSPRLRLHPFTLEEARRLVDATPNEQDHWAEDFPMQDDRDGVGGFLKAAEDGFDATPFGAYRIDDLARDGAAVGTIGFFGPPDEEGQVMFGYGLVPAARGAGFATEAVARLVEFCREHPDVKAMLADTLKDNAPSQRVLDKAGFEFVREDEELFYYRLPVAA
jgi:RimJ/RimL family protein N-acetyltransferase